jgi:GT2 family glycosyltransferase
MAGWQGARRALPSPAMSQPSVAAVLTVFNRVDLTLTCLASVMAQQAEAGVDVVPYVLDDGSSDGTAERVAEAFPTAVVLLGDGSFFWNGGMRVAMARARRDDPDYYLWLNDDTTLMSGTLGRLVRTAEAVGDGPSSPTIVCGAVRDPHDGSLPYSGVVQRRFRPMYFDQVPPGDRPIRVDTMNGNCVLLTREVVRLVGNLSPDYRHGMGDYDYGLRARRAGADVWLAPELSGECRANAGFVPSDDPIRDEFARFRSVKHLPPGEWAHFARAWAGPAWPLAWASPYLKRLTGLLARQIRTSVARRTRRR